MGNDDLEPAATSKAEMDGRIRISAARLANLLQARSYEAARDEINYGAAQTRRDMANLRELGLMSAVGAPPLSLELGISQPRTIGNSGSVFDS